MKLTGLFKQEPPFTDTRRKLRSAIAAGKTTEDADADTALRLILDSPDLVEFAMAIEERESESDLTSRTVRDLLWHLDRLDRDYERKHRE
jgi:hypothetical protein